MTKQIVWHPQGFSLETGDGAEGAYVSPADGMWVWEAWHYGRYEEGESSTLEEAQAHALAYLKELRSEGNRIEKAEADRDCLAKEVSRLSKELVQLHRKKAPSK